MPPPDAEPAVEQSTNASDLLTVTWRAWRLMGRDCGPVRSAVLRIALVTGGPPIIERVDGRPLGAIAERCREPIEQALQALRERERVRRHRTTSRQLRGGTPPAVPAPSASPAPDIPTAGVPASADAPSALEPRRPEVAAAPADAQSDPSRRTQTGIFRCDKQAITDRIERLKREPRPAEAKADPKTDAIARIAALRALQAPRRTEDGAMTPFDEAASAPEAEAPPDKRSSSVFRCEREVITDRITRLKRKPEPPPPSPPPAEGTWDGEQR